MRIILLVTSLLAPALAQAESRFPETAATLHLTAGCELMGGDAFLVGFRGHALVGTSFGDGPVRPELSVGGTFGSGYLSVDDMRALDGSLSLALTTFGPEAQLGLRFANGGVVDNRIYASFAVLRVSKDRRLALDDVPGVSDSNARGYRASFGASWVDAVARAASRGGSGGRDGAYEFLLILAPSQAELAWERSAGTDRYGLMFGWGL